MFPGLRSAGLVFSSRQRSQTPVARTIGPWPPCSVVQLNWPTWIIVGSDQQCGADKQRQISRLIERSRLV